MKITLAIMMASLLVMSSFVVPMNHAFASTSFIKSPTAANTIIKSVTADWQDPEKAITNDGQFAHVALEDISGRNISDYLVLKNLGFTGISNTASVTDIKVDVRAKSGSSVKVYNKIGRAHV